MQKHYTHTHEREFFFLQLLRGVVQKRQRTIANIIAGRAKTRQGRLINESERNVYVITLKRCATDAGQVEQSEKPTKNHYKKWSA